MPLRTLLVLLLVPAIVLPLSARRPAAPDPEIRYERRGDDWYRLEGGFEYRVDPRVVSVRFSEAGRDAREVLSALAAPLSDLRVVRSNALGIHDLEIPAGADPLELVRALRATGLCDFAEENTIGRLHFIPNDAAFIEQWNFHSTGQLGASLDADIDAPEAWDIEDGDPSIVIAVIDSGADDAHPDLAGNMWTNPNETLNGLDDDNNGYVDDVRGWDFVDDDNDPVGNTPHGTAVAGMPGAVGNNGLDLAGLAGGAVDGAGCRIMNLQMSNASTFLGSAVDDAILYAADNGAHVVTMSLGIGRSTAMNQAIAYAHDVKGLFVNCSAGNNGSRVEFPANHPLVVAVGSSNKENMSTPSSGRGIEIDVVAPGASVPSLALGGGIALQFGTSFSSPTVAGLAGLIRSVDPELTSDAVRQLMQFTADDIDAPGFDTNTGWGRINAHQALAAIDTFVPYTVQGYGSGLSGTGDGPPVIQIVTGTRPGISGMPFALGLSNARPSSTSILGLSLAQGSVPFKGGTILIGLSAPRMFFSVATGETGTATQTVPLPNDPTLLGMPFFAQWLVVDPGAPRGWAMSAGLGMTLGS